MCNPRRVHIRATRQLAEAWSEEIERTVQLSEVVVGEARVVQPLGENLGELAHRAFEHALEVDPDWHRDDDGYRFQVDGGYARYDPDTRNLEVVAQLSDRVEATGVASERVGGELTGEIEAVGEGRYYDDEWGGRTEETATHDARRDAEQALDAQAEERRRAAVEAAERDRDEALRLVAAAEAQVRLAGASERRQSELGREAALRLARVQVQCRRVVNALLAVTYRDAILAYAREHGAENVELQESGGVVEIQFEMEG